MPHTKLLEGILDKERDVVIKVTDETTDTLSNEWEIYLKARKANCEGFMRYICYFTCADNITNVMPDRGYICEGPGTGLNVLMMEYVKNKSFGEYNWTARKNIDMFRACCKQVVCTMVDAFQAFGFRHNDLHPKNVLLKSTRRASIAYNCGVTVPCSGSMRIVLMDFELSQTAANSRFLFMDLWTFFGKLLTMPGLDDYSVSPVTDFYSKYKMEAGVDPLLALEGLAMIDRIRFVGGI
jgi:serine/threonine protein kinase